MEGSQTYNFKPSEHVTIDNFLLPFVKNEPSLFKDRLSDEEKLVLFQKIFHINADNLFAENPGIHSTLNVILFFTAYICSFRDRLFVGLIGKVTPQVLQKRWRGIRDSLNRAVKKNLDARTPFQKKQLQKWEFCMPFLSNYNEGKESYYAAATGMTQESEVASETDNSSLGFTQLQPHAPNTQEPPHDQPPTSWMPQVNDAARRQLEWQTNKRIKLAKNKNNLLEVPDEERQVDHRFKRGKPAAQQGVFTGLIDHFEQMKEQLQVKDANSSSKWARMVNAHIMAFPPNQRQMAFDTALQVINGYTKRHRSQPQ